MKTGSEKGKESEHLKVFRSHRGVRKSHCGSRFLQGGKKFTKELWFINKRLSLDNSQTRTGILQKLGHLIIVKTRSDETDTLVIVLTYYNNLTKNIYD